MTQTLPSINTLPWLPGPSILAAIRAWEGREPCPLPDEEPANRNKIRFAPGAWDGIATHHMGRVGEHDEARHVLTTVEALARLVREKNDVARADLYRLYLAETVSPHADALVEEIIRQQEFGPEKLRLHARWLVSHAAHREPLKLGILLLGLCGTEDDLDDLKQVARHDEFTLFAAVAAGNLLSDPVKVWWDMARNVHGWGKVQLVERLCQHAEDRPALQDWLLRHGCDNDIMPEYLAFACATAGRLIEALSGEVDDELLEGARTIVRALLCGGPAQDIDSYPDSVLAVRYLLHHLETRCDTLARLGTVRQIHDWLEWPTKPVLPDHLEAVLPGGQEAGEAVRDVWAERAERGWTETVRAEVAEACQEILRRPEWAERVRAGHRSADPLEQDRAWKLAPVVGVDLWEEELARLTADPLNANGYWNLMRTNDAERIARVIALAEVALPLDEIGSGPSDQLGLGPEFRPHRCLGMLLQEMRRPGVYSPKMIVAGLRSPVINNRNMVINALENRPVEDWDAVVVRAVRQAALDEPRDDVRERLESLLAKATDPPGMR